MKRRDPKAILMDWVDDQVQLDSRTKYILDKFARFADQDARGWALVSELAERTNSSERTVQYALRRLEADGLIRRTGDMHTLNEGSRFPRRVPIFQIASGVEGIDPLAISGARIAPEPMLGCKDEPAGVQLAAPRNELMGTDTPSDEGDARAQEREALFAKLERAYPKRGLGFTNRSRARVVLYRLLDEGLDGEGLIAAAAAFAEDRAGKKTDQSLEYWLDDGKYRGWWPEAQLALEAAVPVVATGQSLAAEADQRVWLGVMAHLKNTLDGKDFGSWISRTYLADRSGHLFVVAWSGVAREWINRRCWRLIVDHWAKADAARRPLVLVSRTEFEAAESRQQG